MDSGYHRVDTSRVVCIVEYEHKLDFPKETVYILHASLSLSGGKI